jgi:hypothetical protein
MAAMQIILIAQMSALPVPPLLNSIELITEFYNSLFLLPGNHAFILRRRLTGICIHVFCLCETEAVKPIKGIKKEITHSQYR